MRTTLTLDDDVEAKLRAEALRTGQPLKTVINNALRASLQRSKKAPSKAFKVNAKDLGLRRGMSLDNISELLEQLEGSSHR